MVRSPLLMVAVLIASSFGCAASTDDTRDAQNTDEGALGGNGLPACASWGGTESFAGLPGDYVQEAPVVDGETTKLHVGTIDEGDSHISSKAPYTREICTGASCQSEQGTAQLLPDNAAFPTNIMFTPQGSAQPTGGYFVLGLKRSGNDVSRICLVRPVPMPGATAAPPVVVLSRVP